MEVLGILSAVVSLLSMGAIFWYLIRWIFSKFEQSKIFRKRFFISVGVFFCATLGAGIFGAEQDKANALRAGFESPEAYRAAKLESVTDPNIWAEIVARREAESVARAEEALAKIAEEAASQKAAEEAEALAVAAKKVAEEAECKKEISCWGEKANTVATVLCPRLIERMARYDYEWTDGMLDVKFSHYRWKSVENAIVTVIGDKIKFQNGFGAWSHMTYECDVDPVTQTIIDVRVSEGRI